VLKRLIETRILDADPLKGLGRFFFVAIQDYLAAPWAVSESDYAYGCCGRLLHRRESAKEWAPF
jgi:hypothetical protein